MSNRLLSPFVRDLTTNLSPARERRLGLSFVALAMVTGVLAITFWSTWGVIILPVTIFSCLLALRVDSPVSMKSFRIARNGPAKP